MEMMILGDGDDDTSSIEGHFDYRRVHIRNPSVLIRKLSVPIVSLYTTDDDDFGWDDDDVGWDGDNDDDDVCWDGDNDDDGIHTCISYKFFSKVTNVNKHVRLLIPTKLGQRASEWGLTFIWVLFLYIKTMLWFTYHLYIYIPQAYSGTIAHPVISPLKIVKICQTQ